MTLKTTLVSALIASLAFLSLSCTVTDSMEVMVTLRDSLGEPLTTYFDYYLTITTPDGTPLIYHNDGQETDSNGDWSYSATALTFYPDPSGQGTCQDTCVTWDDFGCTQFAADCWVSATSIQLDPSQVSATVPSTATVGLVIGGQYTLFPSSLNGSHFTPGSATEVQEDQFDTTFNVNGSTASENLTARHGVARAGRPAVIRDLSLLSENQMKLVEKTRALFGRKHAH